jgi:hypothetical protein
MFWKISSEVAGVFFKKSRGLLWPLDLDMVVLI